MGVALNSGVGGVVGVVVGVKCGEAPHQCWCGASTLFLRVVRRCPTLPHPHECSTIGAVGLSFRVRNGTGRFPHAMTTVTRSPVPVSWLGGLLGVLVMEQQYFIIQALRVSLFTRNWWVESQ